MRWTVYVITLISASRFYEQGFVEMMRDVDPTFDLFDIDRYTLDTSPTCSTSKLYQTSQALWSACKGQNALVVGQLARNALWLPASSTAVLLSSRGVAWQYMPTQTSQMTEMEQYMTAMYVAEHMQ